MALKGDYARLLAGLPMEVAGANIAVNQPKVIDICAYGENDFLTGCTIFTKMEDFLDPIKNNGETQLLPISDFQLLMQVIGVDESLKQMISKWLDFVFPQYIWKFDAGCIQFKAEETGPFIGQINPINIDNFKDVLNTLFFPYGTTEEDFKPANDRAQEIADKLKEGRRKRNELKQKSEGVTSLFANYISTLSVGMGIDMNTLFNYTPFQLFDAHSRYITKMIYDRYQKLASTPLMDVSNMKEPDNWLEDIYK